MTPADPSPVHALAYVGVYWCKRLNRWRAQVSVAGKIHNLGVFASQEDAVASRKRFLTHVGHYKRWRRRR